MESAAISPEEKLGQMLESGKITEDDYQRLLKAVKKFPKITVEPDPEPPVEAKPRKLCKSWKNRQLGGVCGGLGIHLNIEPYIIRLVVFCSLFLSWPIVVLLYLSLYFYLPWDYQVNVSEPQVKGHPWLFVLGSIFLLIAFAVVFIVFTRTQSHQHFMIATAPLIFLLTGIFSIMGYLLFKQCNIRNVYAMILFLFGLICSAVYLVG
jgi:phage shock protein C